MCSSVEQSTPPTNTDYSGASIRLAMDMTSK